MTKGINDAPGMRGNRSRTQHGPLREKRADTYISTVEHQYHRDFHVRGDMHLETFLRKNGFESLHELIKSDLGK
jgi:hypothetical protein